MIKEKYKKKYEKKRVKGKKKGKKRFFLRIQSPNRGSARISPNSANSEPAKPGFSPVFSPNSPNQGSAHSLLRTRVRPFPFSEPGLGQFLSPAWSFLQTPNRNSEHRVKT